MLLAAVSLQLLICRDCPAIPDHFADDFRRWVKWSANSTWNSFAEFSGNRISSCVISANSFCCHCFFLKPLK